MCGVSDYELLIREIPGVGIPLGFTPQLYNKIKKSKLDLSWTFPPYWLAFLVLKILYRCREK